MLVAVLGCGGSATTSSEPGPSPTPSVEASPKGALSAQLVHRGAVLTEGARTPFGEPLAIVIRGAQPKERVVVKVTAMARTTPFAAWARFEADANGVVDSSVTPSLEGTYTGADADGFFWSGVPTAEATAGLARNDVRFVVETEGRSDTRLSVGRDFGDTARRVTVDAPGIVGALYVPRGETKPGVLIAFGGSEGGASGGESYAAYWAERGYAALGIAYFGEAGLPRSLERIPIEYFERAVAWLDTQKDVDTSKIAVMGGSRGGEAALAIASKLPRVSATIAWVPSGVSWGAPTGLTEVGSWTHLGVDLPFVPYARVDPKVTIGPSGDKVEHHTVVFEKSLDDASPAALDAATFRVENASGPILLLGGADDQIWPSCRLGELSMKRLRASGHETQHGDEALCFAEAGHGFGFPGLSTVGTDVSPDPWGRGASLALGGTPKGTARASRDADDKVRALLGRALH